MTLKEAIKTILYLWGDNKISAVKIAQKIKKYNLYTDKKGCFPDANKILAEVKRKPKLFKITDDLISFNLDNIKIIESEQVNVLCEYNVNVEINDVFVSVLVRTSQSGTIDWEILDEDRELTKEEYNKLEIWITKNTPCFDE